MGKVKFSKGQIYALASLFMAFACYAAEKVFKRLTVWSNTSAILQAVVFTAAVAVVLILLEKSKDIYFGLIAAIFSFKILPPDILMLRSANIDAAAVYFLVRKAALVLFLFEIYKLYKAQGSKKEINAVSIAALLLVVPFFSETANQFAKFALIRTGSMMLPYALQAGFYIAAMAVLMAVCFIYKGKNAALIADFSMLGLVINIARKAASAVIIANAGVHVSKSYICWIMICTVLLVSFALVRRKTAMLSRAS